MKDMNMYDTKKMCPMQVLDLCFILNYSKITNICSFIDICEHLIGIDYVFFDIRADTILFQYHNLKTISIFFLCRTPSWRLSAHIFHACFSI